MPIIYIFIPPQMNQNQTQFSRSKNPFPLFFFTLLSLQTNFLVSAVDIHYTNCKTPFFCGNQEINFPFYIPNLQNPYCGYPGFELSCPNNTATPILTLPDNNNFTVHEISYNNETLRVSNSAVFDTGKEQSNSNCIPFDSIKNPRIPRDKFNLASNQTHLVILSGCNLTDAPYLSEHKVNNSGCSPSDQNSNGSVLAMFGNDAVLRNASRKCSKMVATPVDAGGGGRAGGVVEMLRRGFVMKWAASNCSICEDSGGRCGFDNDSYHFKCFCPDRPHVWRCQPKGNNKLGLKLGVGMSSAGIMAGLMIIMIICFTKKLSKEADSKNIMAASLGCNLAVKRYSFKDVKKLTNKFGDKLGEGGFGSVYKGVLPDGRQVAVKVLNEAKDHGESFINEIASISRTSHVNIVSLLGYCHEGHKRALIYEFMVNGSLEKFIHQDKYPLSGIDFLQLRWEMLYQIALGIGRGLEYLHRGCNTRILHFDIKPHNILLDDEFFPKISDFGLAKLCPSKESIISMTGTRGTAGYIAPEVFSRNFGVVSHKSDVYSYGMMVLEMVGGRKNINAEADRTSEIYFPHWIYSRLELDEELGLQSIVNEDDKEISRKMIIVGLWCIQTNPSNRPPMSQVLKMLEGTLKSLEIPPKPYLSSPPRLLPDTDADSSNWERFMPNKHCLRFVFNSSLMLSVGYPMVVS